jgi:aflatoxin B1 aldehyde reductase
MYKENPKMTFAISQIFALAQENGIVAMEMALRWVVHDSPLRDGDGVIFGASNEEQLRENVGWIKKGTLGKSVVEKLKEIWEGAREGAPYGNLTR